MPDKSRLVTPIQNEQYTGERPLAFAQDLLIMHTAFGPGTGALHECSHIEAHQCTFQSSQALWHNHNSNISHSTFESTACEGLWYADSIDFTKNKIDAVHLFRHCSELHIEDCGFSQAAETLWLCSAVRIRDCTFEASVYLFMNSDNLEARSLQINGNGALQYVRNATLHNCTISSDAALWGCQNVKIYDSEITGARIGWHSNKLHLISCTLNGPQPLCYARNLIIEDCSFGRDCELAFEYSSLIANISGTLPSIKNPLQGLISSQGYGAVIVDEHDRSDGKCTIKISGV